MNAWLVLLRGELNFQIFHRNVGVAKGHRRLLWKIGFGVNGRVRFLCVPLTLEGGSGADEGLRWQIEDRVCAVLLVFFVYFEHRSLRLYLWGQLSKDCAGRGRPLQTVCIPHVGRGVLERGYQHFGVIFAPTLRKLETIGPHGGRGVRLDFGRLFALGRGTVLIHELAAVHVVRESPAASLPLGLRNQVARGSFEVGAFWFAGRRRLLPIAFQNLFCVRIDLLVAFRGTLQLRLRFRCL